MNTQINRDAWPATPDPKKIALVIAGAGSLGSYEAGVLSELTYALEILNGSLPAGEGKFVVDVITGASAGSLSGGLLARIMMYESDRRDRLYSAWVREIGIDGLLEKDPTEPNALLSKGSIRKIAEQNLAGTPIGSKPASFAPEVLRLGMTLSNMNGLDYQLKTRTLAANRPGFLTTRFSDEAIFQLTRVGTAVDWPVLRDCAIASGNFPIAFMPQLLQRDASHYLGSNPPLQSIVPPPPDKAYFPHDLAYIDGGLFDNEPLGMAINLATEADQGSADPQRLFLLVHPNITRSGHRDATADGVAYLAPEFGLGAQIGRLLNMLMTENAVSDWVRAHKVNALATWRGEFVDQLVQLISVTQVPNAAPLVAGLQKFALQIGRSRSVAAPDAYVQAALQRIERRESRDYAALGTPGAPQNDRQRVFLLVLFILDHVADLQDKTALWLEVIGHDPATPLAGSQVNGFAGFFNEEWRAYDYRRGRFDAWSAFTGAGQQGLLGDYPREPLASQPSKPTTPDNDEYNQDLAFWRRRLNKPDFPHVTFADVDESRQHAFRDRIADRLKAVLGISGITGAIFNLFIKPKIDKLLRGDER
jgi:predicted acylesterase/phospholipase RssA